MNILLIGPQGSGKGTQARLLVEKYGLFYFESGAFLRKIADKNLDLKKSLAEGKMVPDREMTSYLTAFLDEHDLYDDVIFDGFPRTVDQYKFLKNWLIQKKVRLDIGIVLEIDENETLKRLGARRLDPLTGKIYNLITEKPPRNVDPKNFVQRDDDKSGAIKKRLSLYHKLTEPLISLLKKDSKVYELNGARSVDVIAQDIDRIIEDYKNGNKN